MRFKIKPKILNTDQFTGKTIKQRFSGQGGFSLVELLVVIAIIGVLAAIAIVSFTFIKAKSRDAQRVAEIKNLKIALELYNNENEDYVIAGDCDTDSWIVVNGSTDVLSQALIGLDLFPAGGAPRDPMAPNQNYDYCYWGSTGRYQLRYTLETDSSAGPQGTHTVGP